MKKFQEIKTHLTTCYVDGASLAAFRILLGFLLFIDAPYILRIAYFATSNTFKEHYYGFEWVQGNESLIWLCSYLLPLTAFFMMIGFLYRIAMPLSTVMVAYLFLVCPEHYLNHHYMLWLFIALMSVVPAQKVWSIDALLQEKRQDKSKKQDDSHANKVPVWSYWILKAQTEIILIYAGLVKINPDWLNLQPLSMWLRYKYASDIYIMRAIYSSDFFIGIAAYGVIILHVIGAPLLLWRKTRIYVFFIYVSFHLLNSMTFDIRIFPFMTIGATLLFFDPDWPRRFVYKLRPITLMTIDKSKRFFALRMWTPIMVTLGVLWFAFQVINPAIPLLTSNNQQTEWSGHNSSFTWRMMLNDNRIYMAFAAHLPERRRIEIVRLEEHLSDRQQMTLCTDGNKILQFAQYLKEYYSQKYNTDDVRIHAYIDKSLNYREAELLVNPATDLTQFKQHYGPHEWMTTSTKPLRSIEEYAKSPYTYPTYRAILDAMDLPEEEIIVLDNPNATLDSVVRSPKDM